MLYDALGRSGPVSLVFLIVSLAPLIPVLAAPFLFKERIRAIQAFGILLALAAIVVLNMSPSSSATTGAFSLFAAWMLYTLLALVLFGVTFITQKGATYFISDELSTIAYTVGFILLDFVLFLTDESLVWNFPPKATWISLFIGILMGAGTLTLFAAYRYGKASIVTPFSQLYPIITVLVGVEFYREPMDLLRGIGVVAALAAGVILSLEKESPPATVETVRRPVPP
jgi:drug/metabolite transporter (DMT)-like permease